MKRIGIKFINKMKKTKAQLVADYKKSNKVRREKLAKTAGFKTGEEYLKSLTTIKSSKKVKVAKKQKEMLDYVVAFDTTGSMMSYIEDVKNHVENLIPQMFDQDIDLRMKIVAFGDYCDMINSKEFGPAYQESQLTDNQKELQNFVKGAKNTSGGDIDEFYELVIKKIVEETPWREGSKRAVLFIADQEPHAVGYRHHNSISKIDWKEEAAKAKNLGIAFDTMAIHGGQYPWYAELSAITGGINMPFKSSEKTSEIVAASAYVRGSAKSRAAFTVSYDAAVSSGDTELVGTYKSLSSLL